MWPVRTMAQRERICSMVQANGNFVVTKLRNQDKDRGSILLTSTSVNLQN